MPDSQSRLDDLLYNELHAFCVAFVEALCAKYALGDQSGSDLLDLLDENCTIMADERVRCLQTQLEAKTAECEQLQDELRRAKELIDGRINA